MARKPKTPKQAAATKAPAADETLSGATAPETEGTTTGKEGEQIAEGQSGAAKGGETTAPAAPKAPADKAPADKGAKVVPAYWVTIRTKGRKVTRRRAGMRFGPEAVPIDVSMLSDEQKAAIEADPALIIEPVENT
ncbi:MAG: hypothetical protein WD046_13870 [Paracoccaceae bacterium]